MTAKKKRLLFMVLGVCLCALIAVLIGGRGQYQTIKRIRRKMQ